jgi:hypothetical protein
LGDALHTVRIGDGRTTVLLYDKSHGWALLGSGPGVPTVESTEVIGLRRYPIQLSIRDGRIRMWPPGR